MATINLCTTEQALNAPAFEEYARKGATVPASLKEFLALACEAVSDDVETACGRWFREQAYVEVFSGRAGGRLLRLRAYPVDTAASFAIKEAIDSDFTNVTAIASTSYAVLDGGRSGLVQLRPGYGFSEGSSSIQVSYTGGLAPHQEALPKDLTMAAIEQVVFVARRNPDLHLQSESHGEGGNATYFRDTDRVPSLERAIARYRRIT